MNRYIRFLFAASLTTSFILSCSDGSPASDDASSEDAVHVDEDGGDLDGTDTATPRDTDSSSDGDIDPPRDSSRPEDSQTNASDGTSTDVDASDVPEPSFVEKTGQECPNREDDPGAVGAEITVGPMGEQAYETVFGDGSDGRVTISRGEWVVWKWDEGLHDVVGDASTNFEDDLDDACGQENTTWFQSPTRSSGTFCVQFETPGTFHYQCTVFPHCESGMWGRVEVTDE